MSDTRAAAPAPPINVDMDAVTLRDYFAAQALIGYLAMHADSGVDFPEYDRVADRSYKFADAMLRRRVRA